MNIHEITEINPCSYCGACCAYYPVTFSWTEGELSSVGGVPMESTEYLDDFNLVMKGTYYGRPRCVALIGEVGKDVTCGIYKERSSACRNFEPFFKNGQRNPSCDSARVAHGLKPLDGEWTSHCQVQQVAEV